MDFWRTTEILSKRKWLILLSVIVATAMSWGATRLVGSRWTGNVQFIAAQPSPFIGASGAPEEVANTPMAAGMDVAKSQSLIYSAIVKSHDVMEPSLKELHMNSVPHDVDFVSNGPRLFQLTVGDSSKNRAQSIANALARNFTKAYHRIRTQQVRKSVLLLESQVRAADTRLMKARKKYDDSRTAKGIIGTVNTAVEAASQRLREAHMKHDDTSQKLVEFQARLGRLTSEIAQLPRTVPVQMAAANPLSAMNASQLEDDLAKAEQTLADARSRYTDTMPQVQKALAARDALAKKVNAMHTKPGGLLGEIPNPTLAILNAEQRNLQQDIVGTQALVAALGVQVVTAQQNLDRFKGIDGPMEALAGEVTSQKEARDNLAARLHNAQMFLDTTESQDPISVMDYVGQFNPPVNTTAGRTQRLIGLAALCALLATSGLVIAFDTVDRRLRTVKEAEIALPAPVLAAIPQPMGEITYSTLGRATELFPQSLHSESYRFLALDLLSRHTPPIHSLMICSAKAEQGSTTALTNLGISLAQSGKRVILVDANIRTPELHQVFEVSNDFGFTDLLARPDKASFDRALRQTSVDNLQIVTSGPQPANPWMAFRSPTLREVSQQLNARADYVLFDTPSSIIFTDALNLASVVDAAYLSVRALEPVTGGEERLAKLLHEEGVPILGCILNDVPAAVVTGYHNYQHYYQPAASTTVVTSDAGSQNAVVEKRLQSWVDVPSEDHTEDRESKG